MKQNKKDSLFVFKGSIIYGGCKVNPPFIFLYKKGHNLNQIFDKINLKQNKEMRF